MSIGINNSLICRIFILVCFITIIPSTFSEEEKKCIQVKPVSVDSDWIKKKGKDGFYSIAHTNCERHKESKDEKDKDGKPKDKEEDDGLPKPKAGATRMCWEAESITKDKTKRNGTMICDYNSIETQYCSLLFGKTGTKVKLVWNILKTDNSTYFVRGSCNFAKENLWFIHSTEPEMKEDTRKEIMSDLEKLGYNITNTAVEGESTFFIKKFKVLSDCPKPRAEDDNPNPVNIASKLASKIF